MLLFAPFIVALAVTMALIPALARRASSLRLMDLPNERKVHVRTIPRVGGIAMIIGAMLPVFLWVPFNKEVAAVLGGIGILCVFGVWDDRGDLDYRLKFLGQFLAAAVVVLYGGIAVEVLPFFGLNPIAPVVSIPLTLFVLVGVTNAINLADGLDGLAGGMVLLSLCGIALLAYLASGAEVLIIAVAVLGAVLGFLRYNAYPARIFMGDAGSQFLGFTVAVLAIILTQQTNRALNPALPLLLLGVPIFDTLFVMSKRLYYGQPPFSADNNHIHHQLLGLGLDHYEAVAVIYIIQTLFVVAALLFRYESDLLVVSLYVGACLVLAGVLIVAGRAGWRAHQPGSRPGLASLVAVMDESQVLKNVSLGILWVGISTVLFVIPIMASTVDRDLGIGAGILFGLLLARLIFGYKLWFVFLRLLIYVCIAFVVYLGQSVAIEGMETIVGLARYTFFGVMLVGLVLAIRFTASSSFNMTPTDLLVAIVVVALAFFGHGRAGDAALTTLVMELVILFYGSEVLLRNMQTRWNGMTLSALWAFGVIAWRGMG